MPKADTIRSGIPDATPQPWAVSRDYAWLLTWLTAILLLLTLGVFVWALGYSAQTFRVVRQTRDFNLGIQQLLSELRDAEAGQRAFVLTGSDIYLQPYNAALSGVDAEVEGLRRKTVVSRRQREGLNEIASLAHRELAFIGETVTIYRDRGREAARTESMSTSGLEPMNRLRRLIADMLADSEPLVWKRASQVWKNLVIGLLFGCGSIFACVCFSLVSMRLSRRRLTESEERFRQIADGIPPMAWMTDAQGSVYWYNQRWYDYTGGNSAQIADAGPNAVHPDCLPDVLKVWKESISNGQIFEMEFPLRRADGVYRDFLTRTRPRKDKEGKVVGWFGTNTDITELTHVRNQLREANERLEAGIAERTAELVSANKELEAFAYSVSHDLRAPLRHMDGFADLLRRNCYEKLDAQGQRYLDRITTAAQRMGRLIDDLLSFSRLLRTDLSRTRVSLQALQAEVRRDLESDLSQRSIDWVVGDLPEVTGDHSLLRQVFVNLLSNAVKYTRGRAEARIEIGCAGSTDEETTIFVRDNGAGFEMEYVGKLFEVFQRLHSDAFEGNGIGLATVRRIVERHGGRVWAEGEVDRGATFYCSLRLKRGG